MINKLLKAETSLSSAIFKEKEGHKGLIENRPSDPVEIAVLIYGSCIQYVLAWPLFYLSSLNFGFLICLKLHVLGYK